MAQAHTHGSYVTIPALDGFRALSVAVVLAGHSGISRLIPGGFGVTIFFFLSGFLITTLFMREAASYGSVSIRAFYMRRFLRLSPPLLITLAIAYSLVAAGVIDGFINPMTILSQALYFYNYYALLPGVVPEGAVLPEGATGLRILWSLAVEEHFYLVYPLLFVLIMRGRVTLWQMGGILGFFLAWRLFNWHIGWGDHLYTRSDTRFDSILWGCLLALWQGRGIANRIMPLHSRMMWVWLGAAVTLLLVGFLVRSEYFRETWRYTLQGMALVPIFHYAVMRADHPAFRWLNWEPLVRIGVFSYSIYLIHYVILKGLAFNGINLPPVGNFVVVGTLSFLYAAAVSRYVEAPVRSLRHRVTGHRLQPTAAE